jgi:hypothetical protein
MSTTANFDAGYYNLEIPGMGWAQHTFVVASSEGTRVNFQCYGGTSGPHQVFPAELYTPSIYSYTDLKTTHATGNLDLARAIATCDPKAPHRPNYNQRTGGVTSFGDDCGILYAITGVCHQMAARILYACRVGIEAPIVWPPTVTATYWKFGAALGGFYGTDWHLWKPRYDHWASGNAVSVTDLIQHARLVADPDATSLLQTQPLEGTRFAHIQSMLNAAIGEATVPQFLKPCSEKDLEFERFKKDLDAQLLHGQISNPQYAEAVNKRFAALARDLANVLGPENYQRLFRVSPDKELTLSIDPAMMPESYVVPKSNSAGV